MDSHITIKELQKEVTSMRNFFKSQKGDLNSNYKDGRTLKKLYKMIKIKILDYKYLKNLGIIK